MKGGDVVETTVTRETAIAKLQQLPSDDALKVLIFMMGLDAGSRIDSQNEEHDDTISTEQQIA